MASRQSIHDPRRTTFREIHGHRYRFLGQLDYENDGKELGALLELFSRVGVRLYQDVESARQYLCIESPETGEEAWYRVDGAKLSAAEDAGQPQADCIISGQPAYRPRHGPA